MNVVQTTSTFDVGQAVDVFLRPEAIKLTAVQDGGDRGQNSMACTVSSVLFNGANSAVKVRDTVSGAQINVALPQTGSFADLSVGDDVFISWDPAKARVYAASGGGS